MSEEIFIEKPWGSETIWAKTDKYVGKILYIKAGKKLSLQFHKEKEETILVTDGVLLLRYGEEGELLKAKTLKIGETFHVKPGLIHRFEAVKEDVTLIEVSTPELDDVVRLEDDYGRVEK